MGAAVPDEAGQEPDDRGQADTNQQRVLEGIQHWEGEIRGTELVMQIVGWESSGKTITSPLHGPGSPPGV